MQMPLNNLEKGLRIIARSRKQNKTKTFTQFTIVVITTKSDSRQNQIRNKTRVKILNSETSEVQDFSSQTRTFSGPFFAHFRTSQAYSLARGLGQNQRSQQPISCSDISAQSLHVYNACPQPLTEGTVLLFSPFLLQIDTFGKWLRCLTNVCYLKLKNSDIWTNSDYMSLLRPLVKMPTAQALLYIQD